NDGSVRADNPGSGAEVTGPSGTTTTTTTTPTTGTTSPSSPTAPTSRSPGAITVDVRNASQTRGLAGTVQEKLVRQGFLRGSVGDQKVQDVSVIRYASGDQYSAQLVAS